MKTILYRNYKALTVRFCLLTLLLFSSFQANSDYKPSAEYKLKAALLYKLTKFVKWSAKDSDATQQTFGLCLLGEDYFGSSLDALEGLKVAEKTIIVRRLKQSREIESQCNLVFISDSKKAFLRSILKTFEGKPILSVGDVNGFAEQGGIIEFTSGKRIGFKINIEQSKSCGLQIAAPLLQLSTIAGSSER